MVWDPSVFGIQFGSIYQTGIFQSAGPIPKISKPPRPIHWWWKKQAHPGDPQPLDAFASNFKSGNLPGVLWGILKLQKFNPQVGSGANTSLRLLSTGLPKSFGWIIIKTLSCKSHDIPNPNIIWFSGTSLRIWHTVHWFDPPNRGTWFNDRSRNSIYIDLAIGTSQHPVSFEDSHSNHLIGVHKWPYDLSEIGGQVTSK